MATFPSIIVKLPLTPKTNNHSRAQAPVEDDLKGLLPAASEETRKRHSDERLPATEVFSLLTLMLREEEGGECV